MQGMVPWINTFRMKAMIAWQQFDLLVERKIFQTYRTRL
jgi:hypothetical protein